MVACHSKVGVEMVTPVGEPDLDMMAQRVHNLFKFKNFYDQMKFSLKLCLAIIKLPDMGAKPYHVKNMRRW